MNPIIGIYVLTNLDTTAFQIKQQYIHAIEKAGGIPLLIPSSDGADMKRLAGIIDGLLLPGGPDISPQVYGEEPIQQVKTTHQYHDKLEIQLVREVKKLKKPILGICRGMQLINICFGGTLWQDIVTETNSYICHAQDGRIRSERTHSVELDINSKLYSAIRHSSILVNSYHHQAVKDLAPGFKVAACSKDGIIEGIESDDGVWAVQWHPEDLYDQFEEHYALFRMLVGAAQAQADDLWDLRGD